MKVLVALYNMGGPESVEAVESFLNQLFHDPDLLSLPGGDRFQDFVAKKIISKRLEEVQSRYVQIGGKSPQLPITLHLASKIKDFLRQRGIHQVIDVVPLMRYSSPRAGDILARCEKEGAALWLFPQYPHCSRATTGSSLRDVGFNLQDHSNVSVSTFDKYFDHPEFIELWTQRIKSHWESLPHPKHLVVSAHNLPVSYIAEGDPYKLHIYKTAHEVCRRLHLVENIHWTMAWQSSVGPVRWMKPDTRDVIKDKNKNHLLLWPISFVSDHIETLHEIDMEFKEIADEAQVLSFQRVKNLNGDDDFVQFSALRIAEALKGIGLRNLKEDPNGELCHLQPGGCLCARYFQSGLAKQKRKLLKRK